MQRHFV
jgi:choline dehydrogenase-like flavoprotein